jgi:hypothetical protein
MAFQRPERSEGGRGAGHSSSLALPLAQLERTSNVSTKESKSKRSVEALEAEIRRLRAENAKLFRAA